MLSETGNVHNGSTAPEAENQTRRPFLIRHPVWEYGSPGGFSKSHCLVQSESPGHTAQEIQQQGHIPHARSLIDQTLGKESPGTFNPLQNLTAKAR